MLEVNYTLFPSQLYWGVNGKQIKGIFRYDLSPASNWGNGTAREIQIVVDTTELITNQRSAIQFDSETIPFKQKGNGYEYRAINYRFC